MDRKERNMIVKKNDKEYSVIEREKYWEVSYKNGKVILEYKVSKDICADEKALSAYIQTEEIF